MDFLIYAVIGAAVLVVVGFVIGFVIGFRRSVAAQRSPNAGAPSAAVSRAAATPSHRHGTAVNHRQDQNQRGGAAGVLTTAAAAGAAAYVGASLANSGDGDGTDADSESIEAEGDVWDERVVDAGEDLEPPEDDFFDAGDDLDIDI
ncbi:hypothetical protein CKO15_09880 [Halorhodospira abdelmalekii]|uniref:hypothetical protein n=1 Tax=Halorhodospira abdelmalekii TaxID=421629 RepID=UPI001907AFC1|nr:hypothetical protein [Halorhodospira abdelmalekii]MBK1735587.1 hypothetical protein [Halorhodospira abdelmalekii]